MVRQIIHIDEEKCNGCGLCAKACHEGAIEMVNGKARLMRDDYCDGLGDCLPECPTGAIRFVEREAAAYNEQAVREKKEREAKKQPAGGCPGARIRTLNAQAAETAAQPAAAGISRLAQWPCQLRLAPVKAPYFDGARLLVAADCTAYACAGMHEEFMRGRVTLIGCPKLDAADYAEKLGEILRLNDVRSLTVVRMEVPCCGGLARAAEEALRASGKLLPWQVVTLSVDGKVLDRS